MKKKLIPGSRDIVARPLSNYSGEITDISYGKWHDDKKGNLFIPALLSGSDYSGSLVEKSNNKAFQEEFASGDREWWTDAPGGHGTFAIVIDMDKVPDDISDDVAEFFQKLEDYPLADEDLHSQMEHEAENEAWENWAKADFKKALERRFDIDLDEEKIPEDKIYEVYHQAMDKGNVEWVNEQGSDMYIDIERLVRNVPREMLWETFGKKV